MAFVKLDTGILDSTLWVCRDPREVFITALLMARPYEVTAPMPQYRVGSIDATGFVVEPGWYGFVEASGPGIVRRAGLSQDVGMDALHSLGEPDSESRSSDYEGRRMVRVDGGYIILNYMRYRDKDNTAALRQKRFRERQRLRNSESTKAVTPVTRDSLSAVTIAEAEEEAEVNLKHLRRSVGEQPLLQAKPETARASPTESGSACLAMRKAGLSTTNPSHPKLAALLAAGITEAELAYAAQEAASRGKGFAYALATAEGRRREAAVTTALPKPGRGPPKGREGRIQSGNNTIFGNGGQSSGRPDGDDERDITGESARVP